MFNRLTYGVAILALFAGVAGPVLAGEKTRIAAAGPVKDSMAKAADMAAIPGTRSKLEVAAEAGVLDAQLKLAAKYAAGDGAKASQKRAFELYQRIVKGHADVRPGGDDAAGVARAYVALGNYYRAGIPGALGANKPRAVSLLHYAASFYGDADAQCDLAQMYLDGEGVARNERLAANWLANAAKKRHGRSQALLGDLLMRGTAEVERQPEKGLALLSLARQNASDEVEARWIEGMYRGAHASAGPAVRELAKQYAALWRDKMGRQNRVVISKGDTAGETAAVAAPDAAAKEGVMPVGHSHSEASPPR